MGQTGKHTVIIDGRSSLRGVLETVLRRTGRPVTIAKDAADAVAVLRSSLHALVVYIGAEMPGDGPTQRPLLLDLLANPEFAATHAFIVVYASDDETADTLRGQASANYLAWLRLPAKIGQLITAQEEAEDWLRSRGG